MSHYIDPFLSLLLRYLSVTIVSSLSNLDIIVKKFNFTKKSNFLQKEAAYLKVLIILLDEFLHQYFHNQCQHLKILHRVLGSFVQMFLHH